MSETIDLQAQIDQLTKSNESLTATFKSFNANKRALETTVQELMTANINLKAALEMAVAQTTDDAARIKNFEAKIQEFEDKAKAAEAPAEEKAPETAPVEDAIEAA